MLTNYLQIFKTLFGFIFDHWFLLAAGIVFVFVILILGLLNQQPEKPKYQYKLKDLIMTRSEFEFFKILTIVVGSRYDIFPQIHLDAILNNKVNGQSWFGAFRHINEKSVDFVLTDKTTGKPILAIELDDRSHERENRIIRDEEVERILSSVNLKLLRVKDKQSFSPDEVSNIVNEKLNN